MLKINNPFARRFLVAAILTLTLLPSLFGQTYSDGPIQLQARLRQFNITFPETDIAFFGVVGQPDDLTYNLWFRDAADVDGVVANGGWGAGSGCLTEGYILPLTDWNLVLFNFTYPTVTVPQFLQMRVDFWEDESPDQLLGIGCGGSRCAYDVGFCCGGFLFGMCLGAIDDDDLRCNSNANAGAAPYAQLDYRLGPPCEWFNQGFVTGTCANNVYLPRIETFWRYTRGENCNAGQFIDLGTLNSGFSPITHFNSNVCYSDDMAFPNGGRDVVYGFTITQPTGLTVNTCGPGTLNSDVYILNSSCTMIYSNTGGCGTGSTISQPLCQPGQYFVVVEGRANSQGTFTLQIQETPNLVVRADAGPNVSVCQGLGVTMGAQLPSNPANGGLAGYTYNWLPNTFLTSNTDSITVAFPPTTTQYVLEVTDALGCVDRDTTIVTVNPGPTPNLGPNQTVCPGTPVTFDAGTGFVTYFWSNGSFNQQITTTLPGQYIAVVSDLNGCMGRDTVDLAYFASAATNLGPDTAVCVGNTVTLDAGPGFTVYNWSTGATSATIVANTTGSYDVSVTDPNGCVDRDTILVTIDTLPVPSLPASSLLCPGGDVVLNPGAGWPNYSWSNGDINQIVITNTPGPISVTVTDGNGCQGTANGNVVAATAPVGFTVTAPATSICDGQSLVLSAGSSGAVASYFWSNGGTTNSITVTAPGLYSVIATDTNGCQWADSITISVFPNPVVTLGATDTLCAGATSTLDAGPGFASYAWSTGANTQTVTVGNTGTYSVTITDANGCTATDSKDLIGSTIPAVDLGAATVNICDNGSAILDAGPQYIAYQWAPVANPNQYLIVNQPGTYNVTVTDQFGCNSSDSVSVTTNAVSPLDFMNADTIGCAGQDLLLDAGDQWLEFAWNTGSPDQYLLVSANGTYEVTVTDSSGCRFSDTTMVTMIVPPVLELGPAQNICPGEVIVLDAGAGFDSYLWNDGSTAQTLSVNVSGAYSVTVTSSVCTLDDNTNIGDDCQGRIFIPNVFSPNGDGLNDVFKIDYVNLEYLDISIYDRWGKFIYQSGDKNFQWNGTINGKNLPEGVYYYQIEYKYTDNENILDDKGTITLLR